MKKKEENYKYAKRIGLVIIICWAIWATLVYYAEANVGVESSLSAIPPYGLILPFIVGLFYPYPDEWGIVRKAWKWFWIGVFRAICYILIAIAVVFATAMVRTIISG